jgi:hypothetical protein
MSNQRPNSTVEFKQTEKEKKQVLHLMNKGFVMRVIIAELKKKINWKERDQELEDLCNRFRRNDGRYDVVVPGSGGKG